MVFGEGASAICLEKGIVENALATILGVGFATEVLEHNTSIYAYAKCFQKSMKMALGEMSLDEVDVIFMHAPGTIKVDQPEVNAIRTVFVEKSPFLTTNKWNLGHTFGAFRMLRLELGLFMLQPQQVLEVPFSAKQMHPQKIRNVLIKPAGFGGDEVSVLLSE